MTSDREPTKRWPAFDGLRAVAVITVIIYHLQRGNHISGGYTGVNVFFVLSGFLITTLLVEEWNARGGIELRAFWMRRVIRLAPALLATILAAVVLALADVRAAQPHETLVGLPWVLLYVGNYVRAFNQDALGILGHTWSLSVEEQFYLLWPPILIWCIARGSRRMWQIIAVVAVLDALWGHIETVAISEARGNFSTDTDAYGLLAGCALALWYTRRPRTVMRSRQGRRILQAGSVLVIAAATVVVVAVAETTYTMTAQVSTVTACTVFLLYQVLKAPGGPVQAALEFRVAQWIGKRSYAFYLYHYIVITAWANRGHGFDFTLINVAKIAVTTSAVGLSWHYLERPIQRRFKPRWQRAAGALPSAGIPLVALEQTTI